MNNPFQMKQQARTLREEKMFVEARGLYQSLWDNHREVCDEWDGWGYAYCLRKLGQSADALIICREVYKIKPDFEHNNGLYAWCIYDEAIGRLTDEQIEHDQKRFFQAANAIVSLAPPGKFSPSARTILRVVDYLKERASYPTERILEWTGKITPDQLSDDVGHGTDERGRLREYASDREKWFAERCKALLEANDFKACIDLADEALGAFSTFHYDNDVWFRWRRALAKAGLGEKEVAIGEIQSLLSRKREWFIYHRIARFQYDLGLIDEAWLNSVEAALAPLPEIENKWGVFLLMGLIMRDQGELVDAQKHVLLSVKVRQRREDWKHIPQELSQAVAELGVNPTSGPSTEDLAKELSRHWQRIKYANRLSVSGEIANLLPNGTSGFIKSENGGDYYFKVKSFKGPHHMLELGLSVEFFVEKNPDPGKRDIAVEVRPHKPKNQTQTES